MENAPPDDMPKRPFTTLPSAMEITNRKGAYNLQIKLGAPNSFLNKQIAYALGISEKTIEVHRGRVMEKLGVDFVAELVRLADKAGMEPAKVSSS